MTSGPRSWLVGAAAVVGIAAVVAAATMSGGETGSGHADLGDVIPYDDIEQLRSTFNADLGHPRLILLVDPI